MSGQSGIKRNTLSRVDYSEVCFKKPGFELAEFFTESNLGYIILRITAKRFVRDALYTLENENKDN